MKHQLKQYPQLASKANFVVIKDALDGVLKNLSSSYPESTDELLKLIKPYLWESHRAFFDMVVRYKWYERSFLYKGKRLNPDGNGVILDKAVSFLTSSRTGVTRKLFSTGYYPGMIGSYLEDFFPNFSDHNPIQEPEYFKFPYKNLNLDHLFFVRLCHDRIEMLEEAERLAMPYIDFANWAYRRALCYNDEVGETVYMMATASVFGARSPFIQDLRILGLKAKKHGK